MTRTHRSASVGSPRSHRVRIAAVTASVVMALAACGSDAPETRQAEVAERGREVMPFDLDATTHHFVTVADGLVQTVVADDPDATQVDLVRGHLLAEASRFERGDFDDPARIHGEEMPGLARLRDHGGRIAVTYRDIARGGEIRYRTSDPELIEALQDWADAQTRDHGDHAAH